MKKIHISILLSLAIGSIPQIAAPQSTIYLSDLSEPSGGSVGITEDGIYAQSFETGNNPGGYNLDAITLSFSGGAPTPPLTPLLFANTVNPGVPYLPPNYPGGIGLGNAGGQLLAPSTIYWIWITADYGSQVGAQWTYASNDNFTSQDNWSLTPNYLFETQFSQNSWTLEGTTPLQISVTATPAPEPTVPMLAGLGLLALLAKRKR
jgi:hypothetical protein